jgi:Mlc titration factor MtfA (ptsG expression regulator)
MGLSNWLRRLVGVSTRVALPEQIWQRAFRRPAWTSALDGATKARLREFTERFLSDKAISAAGGLELDDDQRVLIAMLCCRPVLHLDYGWLQGWHEVIVYPGAFRTPARKYDRDAGTVSEGDRHAIGESWWRGPLVLSWADVLASVDAPTPGIDVVVHEIAHKLDGLHDGVDGAPRLHMDERPGWARDFQAAYDVLRADLDAGREPPINRYAGEAPAEFFAVCSEYWFTAPVLLQAIYPDVAARLAAFYGNPQATGVAA